MPSWRRSIMDIVINDYNTFDKDDLMNYDIYEFGVFRGDSMIELAGILNKHKIEVNKFHGFDVFSGMPKETAEPIFQDSWNPDILPDEFNALRLFGTRLVGEAIVVHGRGNIDKVAAEMNANSGENRVFLQGAGTAMAIQKVSLWTAFRQCLRMFTAILYLKGKVFESPVLRSFRKKK